MDPKRAEHATRAEHIAWAKARALVLVDAGDLIGAVGGMGADLGTHAETKGLTCDPLYTVGIYEVERGSEAVRRWIETFV